MTEMTVVVHRHAADVHPRTSGRERPERLLLSGERVVDVQHVRSPGSRFRQGGGSRRYMVETMVRIDARTSLMVLLMA